MSGGIRYVAPVAALLLAVSACGGDEPGPPGPSTGTPHTAHAPSSPATTASSTDDPTESVTATEPHPSDAPLVITDPELALLDWQPIGGSVEDTVTTNGAWTLSVNKAGDQASLDGPSSSSGSGSSGERVSDALLDDDWAVVVYQDRDEQDPARAVVTDLATGDDFEIDGGSDVPTIPGGTWALGDGHLLHATVGPRGAYCLATVDLATHASTLGWCAEKRHGFNGARVSPFGDSLLTFDDSQPSCRTLVAVNAKAVEPLQGVTDCKGWDGVLTDNGAVWSVVAKDNRVEAAHFYARTDDSYVDLGPGTSGTLTWCHGATYFVRDPQRDGDPARLLAYDGTDLTIAYESPPGEAFLTEPRCGGDTMNITALTESGDEQVSASLG